MKPDWFPDWSGESCVIVASGPSAAGQSIADAQGRCRTIVINNSWRLAPWADALYASDVAWWQTGAGDEFEGLKISRGDCAGVRKVSLRPLANSKWFDEFIFEPLGEIGAGGSSGFQALNLAVQFGAKKIALVGFDARVDLGTHWHGDHGGKLHNPQPGTAEIWRACLDRAAGVLADAGVEVVNCSPVSALQAYPKMSLNDALEAFEGK